MANLAVAELSILLVEPSSTQLKLIMRHLEAENISHIDTASSGEQALEIVRSYPPDLIISAMYLPDMSADELMTALITPPEGSAIPFILISSETAHKALEPILQAGVVAILPKPFEQDDLQRALAATVEMLDPEEIRLQNYDVSELRILLVDDSQTSRNHLFRVISSMGITHIDNTYNGLEAVKLLAKNNYDLIITDLNMPEMDGYQLVQYIRQQSCDVVTPILMTTAENSQQRLNTAKQAGVSAFLDKPVEPRAIREALYRLLD